VSTAAVLAEGTRSVDNAFTDEEQGIVSSANCSICNINSELPEED
jgi:hypothetical protein